MATSSSAGSSLKGLISALVVFGVILGFGLLFFAPEAPEPKTGAAAAAEPHVIEHQPWTFAGVLGHYDNAQLQRGYQVYKEVCASCHSMKLLSYRNLAEAGGPAFTEGQVKTLAAEAEVEELGDDGTPVARPGKPSDRFKSPFPNDNAARSANGGALPPDLSVMAKARNVHEEMPWYREPLKYVRDVTTGYQEGGPDYIYGVLTGYHDAPEGFVVQEGLNYNVAFPGNQIAMPAPLSDGQIEYTDGAPKTLDQYSRDVSAFLMWASEPHLEARKHLGLRVLIYLVITAFLFGLAKRALWRGVPH
ncbi:MAG: cytochrome c1 [Hyphomicrobiaceae bacterium]